MIKLIVGLGNIGSSYAHTRHNAGFWFVNAVADRFGISMSDDKKFFGEVGRGQIHGHNVRLIKPTTLMNRSGQAVAPMMKFFGIAAHEVLVAHDELDIQAGAVRLKTGGGHGGHNGLRDIVPHIGQDFHRLRIGIGHPGQAKLVSNWVLSKPSGEDRTSIEHAIDAAVASLPLILNDDMDKARSAINGFRPHD